MHNPFIHSLLEIKKLGLSKFGVFARDYIPMGTKIETCVLIMLPKITINSLEKIKSPLLERILPNPDGIRREREVIATLSDMEIQRRLDEGNLTPAEAKNILLGPGNITALLEIETGGLLSGFGSLYNRSSYPNITMNFDSESKLYNIITVKDIGTGEELTYLKS
jgi:SET domain-containing protein